MIIIVGSSGGRKYGRVIVLGVDAVSQEERLDVGEIGVGIVKVDPSEKVVDVPGSRDSRRGQDGTRRTTESSLDCQ